MRLKFQIAIGHERSFFSHCIEHGLHPTLQAEWSVEGRANVAVQGLVRIL